MTSNLNILTQTSIQSSAIRHERRQLLKGFWLGVTVLFLVQTYTLQTSSIINIGCAVLITFAALVPVYLWCSGSALGLPIFPVFTLTFLWTYGIPLLSKNPDIISYPPVNILFASATVAGFLGLGTVVWFQMVKHSPPLPKSYRVLRGQDSDLFFLIMLGAGVLFNMSSLGGWFTFNVGTFTLIRSVILGVNVLAVFVLSYRCGTRESSGSTSNLFLFLLNLNIITNTASLLLTGAIALVLIAAIAFTIGRRKVPWLPIILALLCLLPLHYGKHEMREKYWSDRDKQNFVQPWDYPGWFEEWMGYSWDYLNAEDSQKNKADKQSLTDRASLIHLLLLAQSTTPNSVPYLSGQTYSLIPQLLLPRFLNSKKIASHEGTHLLNIHYRLQNRAATLTTTIGWGLLNEAYANFGVLGCAGIAIILGAGYGQATRWCMNTPLLSSRSLFAVLTMSLAFETEFSAGVYIASLFQSTVPLVVITFVLMKVHKNDEAPLFYYG